MGCRSPRLEAASTSIETGKASPAAERTTGAGGTAASTTPATRTLRVITRRRAESALWIFTSAVERSGVEGRPALSVPYHMTVAPSKADAQGVRSRSRRLVGGRRRARPAGGVWTRARDAPRGSSVSAPPGAVAEQQLLHAAGSQSLLPAHARRRPAAPHLPPHRRPALEGAAARRVGAARHRAARSLHGPLPVGVRTDVREHRRRAAQEQGRGDRR